MRKSKPYTPNEELSEFENFVELTKIMLKTSKEKLSKTDKEKSVKKNTKARKIKT